MPNVHILPPDIISKIAAGEVIDRPASVIKELIENALDAGTASLELDLQQAGRTAILLKDTGSGIAKDDIEIVFHRHSTSKIEKADDLFNIHSLGFRGEALYSIAAVADVLLRSKTKGQDSGWEIHMRGNKKIDLKPVSMPDGTEIEVRELFFNTPARRKFLKSNTTELNQILATLIPYALLHPGCRFLLRHQGKNILALNATKDRLQRIAETLNLNKEFFVETEQDFTDIQTRIRLVLGDINLTRSRRDMQFIFINGRPVQSKALSFHLNNVYRLILPQGTYPFFTAYIDIPADQVDVNIHPTKREVKIRDEQTLCAILRQMTEQALMMKGKAKIVELPTPAGETQIQQALKKVSDSPAPAYAVETGPRSARQSPTEQYSFPHPAAALPPDHSAKIRENFFAAKPASLKAKLEHARFVGFFADKFLLFEAEKSLMVVDQHAAQERITFEHLIFQMEKGKVEVQHLLSPLLIKLSPQEMISWEEAQEAMERIGFSSSQFDEETMAVHAYPVLLKDPSKAVREVLAGGHPARCDHESLARRACRASVMAGDRLTLPQAEFQRKQLLACKDPFTCPHGRPTVIEIPSDFLDKQFLRK